MVVGATFTGMSYSKLFDSTPECCSELEINMRNVIHRGPEPMSKMMPKTTNNDSINSFFKIGIVCNLLPPNSRFSLTRAILFFEIFGTRDYLRI